MKNTFFLLILAFVSCSSFAQLQNNCTTTNFLTKRDASGNLVCSSIFDNVSKIEIGILNPNQNSPAFTVSDGIIFNRGAYFNRSLYSRTIYCMTAEVSTVDSFMYFINEKKINDIYESSLWKLGSTTLDASNGHKNGFSIIQGWSPNQTRLFIEDATGNVGIGTTTPPANYKLAVAGKIIAEELKVQLQAQWPDYVFEKEYKLPTLAEVEKQIQENGHLANVPSACEIETNGFEVGDMARIQQQKIEELTLYIIELNKKLEAQEKKMQALEAKINN